MRSPNMIRTLFRMLIGLSALILAACADEQGKGYWLRHASITLAQAAHIAETNESGQAVEAELKQAGSRVFYEVEIIDNRNKSRRVRVDAETGTIIKGLTLP